MEIVGNIVFGFLMLNFGYPIIEGIFTLDTLLSLEYRLHGWKAYSETFPTVYGTPSNFIGMRRYERICKVNPARILGRTCQDIEQCNVGPKSDLRRV